MHTVGCYMHTVVCPDLPTFKYLIAPPVSAHRQRDEVQAVSKGRLFPPSEMTTALVCLNRCMYAQLMQVRSSGV